MATIATTNDTKILPDYTKILDKITSGKDDVPPHVHALKLPRIDGWEPRRVWCTWTVDPSLIQPQGAVFGGYLTAVADEMLGMATMTVLDGGEAFATSESRANYFRPVRGGELTVEATVVHKGRSSVYVEAAFTNADNELVAKAAATQTIIRPKGA